MGTTNFALCASVCPFFTSMEAADEKKDKDIFEIIHLVLQVYLCVSASVPDC